MAKTVRNGKQCTLDVWRRKTTHQQAQTVPMATDCSQKPETDYALKQIFGHDAYKSDVQRKAVSAILTGFKLRPAKSIFREYSRTLQA